jgi:hypothetical protein
MEQRLKCVVWKRTTHFSLCYIKGTYIYTVWAECSIYKFSSYLTGNTLRLRYKAQPVNAVQENNRCLLWESYGTHKYTVWAECNIYIRRRTLLHNCFDYTHFFIFICQLLPWILSKIIRVPFYWLRTIVTSFVLKFIWLLNTRIFYKHESILRNDASSALRLHSVGLVSDELETNFGRKRSWAEPEFAWTDWRQPRKSSVCIAPSEYKWRALPQDQPVCWIRVGIDFFFHYFRIFYNDNVAF